MRASPFRRSAVPGGSLDRDPLKGHMGSQEQELDLEFRTTDLALAAYLCVEGFRFLRIERRKGTHIADIIFDGEQMLYAAVDEYEVGHATVEPRTFQQKVHWLRNKMNPNGNKAKRRG